MKKLNISRKGRTFEVEQLKRCSTSTGYNIFLFRNLGCDSTTHPYIVAVKDCGNETKEYVLCLNVKQACQLYLEYICCYA